eukprot:TRINITY_DN6578_c0_g3_i3.p1 TRINITY_DN6578_c0_g3~~TRINITY_DN6578_c0_g3_i3.p1  ORF type:complete len:631 (+),score=207.64 TRINITY_DN6578_c0_g3_i3:87-1979(+)
MSELDFLLLEKQPEDFNIFSPVAHAAPVSALTPGDTSIPRLQKVLMDLAPMYVRVPVAHVRAEMIRGFVKVEVQQHQFVRYWCEYVDGTFTYRFSPDDERPLGELQVTYCTSEGFDIAEDSQEAFQKKVHEFGDQYLSFLESQRANHCFTLFSPDRVYLCRAEDEATRDLFANGIRRDLQMLFDPQIWADKTQAAKSLEPLLRNQFMLQMKQHHILMEALSASGFLELVSPITSPNKEKSGILALQVKGENSWHDYYFVLFDGSLYWYSGSQAESPTGFVVLEYVSVQLDQEMINQGKNVFRIHTPLRTLVLQAKHEVALAEWVAALEDSKQRQATKEKANAKTSFFAAVTASLSPNLPVPAPGKRRDSALVLEEINRIRAATVDSVASSIEASALFRQFLVSNEEEQAVNELECYLELKLYGKSNEADRVAMATSIYNRFLQSDSKEYVTCVPPLVAAASSPPANGAPLNLFDQVKEAVRESLETRYHRLQNSPLNAQMEEILKRELHRGLVEREVPDFPPKQSLTFVLTLKGSSRSKEFVLERKKNVATIGRDHSNDIVIEDARVSRSHARIDYDETKAEYSDLGSSHGTLLNGVSVLKARLAPGDVLTLGTSRLEFQLKKRRFSFFD